MKKKNIKKVILSVLILAILVASLFLFKSCNKKEITTNETIIEPTINEVVEIPNETAEVVNNEEITKEETELIDITKLSYWVNFLNKDGSILQRTVFKYGVTPKYDGPTPTYTDNTYYYSFKGWDKKISPVKGTQIYTAVYDTVEKITSKTSEPSAPTSKPEVLKFTANTAGSTICLDKNENPVSINLQYSTDGTSWNTYVPGTTGNISLNNIDDYVLFRADPNNPNTSFSSDPDNDGGYYQFIMFGSISASGDITSLLNGVGGTNNATITNYCFFDLFDGCTSLTSAPNLPSTKLATMCYAQMFYGCTSLEDAPKLPATTLADNCYSYMFYGCTSLTTAPALPATTLAIKCYECMFSKCTSLENAPSLPATTLKSECYYSMFNECSKLLSAPALPATTLAESCYYSMFSYCKKLVSAPALPATTLAYNCYSDMFYGCEELVNAPALPATTLAESCYYDMFSGCSKLVSAPALPAETLAASCYEQMFKNCSNLTSAPALPATTLANKCYKEMFENCTSLTSAPSLSSTTLCNECYAYMFNSCTKLKIKECDNPAISNKVFTCPSTSGLNYPVQSMFSLTDGDLKSTGTPTPGKTYYWNNPD